MGKRGHHLREVNEAEATQLRIARKLPNYFFYLHLTAPDRQRNPFTHSFIPQLQSLNVLSNVTVTSVSLVGVQRLLTADHLLPIASPLSSLLPKA